MAKVEYYVESGTDVIGYDTQVRYFRCCKNTTSACPKNCANRVYAVSLMQLPQWLGAIWIEAPADKAIEAVKLMEKLAADTYEHLKVCHDVLCGRADKSSFHPHYLKIRCSLSLPVSPC